MRLRTSLLVFPCLTAVVLLTGCEGARLKPTGKVMSNGQQLKLSDKGVLQVTVYAADDKTGNDPFPTTTQTDGTFTILGKDGRGIPAGTYQFAVRAVDPYPNGKDVFRDKYKPGSPGLPTKEIKDQSEIVLDLK